MSQFRTTVLTVALAAPLLFGCSGGISGSGSGGASALSAATVLEGTWVGCEVEDSNGVSSSMSFVGATYTENLMVYTGGVCSGTPNVATTMQGTFSVGSASSVAGATNLALNIPASFQVTPGTSATANQMNSSSYCGLNNWAANVSQTITSSSACYAGLNASGGVANTIFEITGGTLYFGNSDSTAIDTTTPLQKQ